MTDIQKITLRDILTTAGLSERQVEDIFLLLRFKPERVQMAFYYRACGNTLLEISKYLNVTEQAVHKMFNGKHMIKIKEYLQKESAVVS